MDSPFGASTSLTTPRKLWLGFGVLTAMLVLFCAALLTRLSLVGDAVKAQADIARPRSAATRELEINMLDYAISVHEHVYERAAAARQAAAINVADVERWRAAYARLAETARQRELAARFEALWRPMFALGEALLASDAQPPRLADMARFHELRVAIEEFLDAEMQTDANATYDARRATTLDDVRSGVIVTLVLLVLGSLVAAATGVGVGRGIVRTEAALRLAHDELEARVAERTAALAAAVDGLQRSNRELEQFASVASHDLQEPLRKIQAFGDRLQTRSGNELGAQGREYLERMLASAARMRRLIDDLLAFSRVATNVRPFAPTDLNALAGEVVSDLETRIERSGGQVDLGPLPVLDADPSQMRQLLQNLIGNALKFHRAGVPPVVTVRSRRLEGVLDAANPGAAPPRSMCEITVADNGIGFDETYLDRIFELFQRLHGRDEYEGTGMGLAICRKIAQRHGGHITATSRPAAGSTFIVTLPLRQPLPERTR